MLFCCNIVSEDISLHLFSGTRGLPGIEFRINRKGFLYASLLAGPIIDNEIRRIRLSPTKQCFQQVTFWINSDYETFFPKNENKKSKTIPQKKKKI